MVLIELLTGRKAVLFDKLEMERSLVTYFLISLEENRLFDVLEKHIATEGNVEQLKEVEKHSWINVNSNSKETEHLLTTTSDSSNYDVRNKSTEVYDSMKDHVMLDFDDGR